MYQTWQFNGGIDKHLLITLEKNVKKQVLLENNMFEVY